MGLNHINAEKLLNPPNNRKTTPTYLATLQAFSFHYHNLQLTKFLKILSRISTPASQVRAPQFPNQQLDGLQELHSTVEEEGYFGREPLEDEASMKHEGSKGGGRFLYYT